VKHGDDCELHARENIRAIVRIHHEEPTPTVTDDPNTEILYINMQDRSSEPIGMHFDDAIAFITEQSERGSVLVHCHAGISRSATLVVAYIMLAKRIGYREALTFVQQCRPQVDPNFGFHIELMKFEKSLGL
jgi:protein-tyrosine phosphatase